MKKLEFDSGRLLNLSAIMILLAFPMLYLASWNFESWWRWPGLILFGIGLFLPVLSPFLCRESAAQKGGEAGGNEDPHPGASTKISN